MDLNQLLHSHQVAVMNASIAGDDQERDNHFARVAEYAERIRQLREHNSMARAANPAPGPQTIIYGSYAGDPEDGAPARPIAAKPTAGGEDRWEGEGGALDPPQIPDVSLPDGITTRVVREYRVGPYVYHDLDLALAEHLRQLSDVDDV